MSADFISLVTLLNIAFTMSVTIGGLFAFRHARKNGVITLQNETITALQAQVDTVKDKLAELEKENTRLHLIIETIQAALLKRGIHVTIDGDLVVVSDQAGSISSKARIKKTTEA